MLADWFLGLCDDQHDLGSSGVAMPWTADLWERLLALCPLPDGLVRLDQTPRPLKWNVQPIEPTDHRSSDQVDIYEHYVDAVFDRPFLGTVKV